MWENNVFDAGALKEAGFTAAQLYFDGGPTVYDMQWYFTVEELQSAGFDTSLLGGGGGGGWDPWGGGGGWDFGGGW